MSADLFVGVHAGSWTTRPIEGLDEVYSVNVTVTVRLTTSPVEDWGEVLSGDAGKSLDAELEKIRAAIHLDRDRDEIRVLANQYIGPNANGFVQALVFQDGGAPTQRGGNWFYSGAGKEQWAGISQTLRFGEAVREQKVEEQT
jgi:hypothetical protein